MAGTTGSHQVGTFTTPVAGTTNRATDVTTNDNAIGVALNAHDSDAGIHLPSGVHASRPSSPAVQDKYYETDTRRLFVWNGTAWVEPAYALGAGVTINVKDPAYGAVGDGITNDSAAFQAALNAVTATGTTPGGTVFVPPGAYRLNSAIQINARNTTIQGSGWGTALLWYGGNSACILCPGGANPGGNFRIRDLRMYGQEAGTSECAIWAKAVQQEGNLIENVEILSFGGISIELGEATIGGAPLTSLQNVQIYLNTAGTGAPTARGVVAHYGSNSISITDCAIISTLNAADRTVGVTIYNGSGCSIKGTTFANWQSVVIDDEMSGSYLPAGNSIIGNYFETWSGDANTFCVRVLSGQGHIIADNFMNVINGGQYAIDIASPAVSTQILNNTLQNTSGTYIRNTSGAGGKIVAIGNNTNGGTVWSSTTGVVVELWGDGNANAIRTALTVGGKLSLTASTTSAPTANVPDGTAPTSPATGDVYAVSGTLFVQDDLAALGGYRAGLGGWSQVTTVAASQTDVALVDVVSPRGRIMARAGSITGIAANLSTAKSGGTITAKVQKSTDGGGTWAAVVGPAIGIALGAQKGQATYAKDTYAFAAGDMLRTTVTTDAGFTPTANNLDVMIEVET